MPMVPRDKANAWLVGFLLLVILDAAVASARSLSELAQVQACHFHPATNSFSLQWVSVERWQNDYMKSSYDCCVPSAGAASRPPGPCSTKQCGQSHMSPHPWSRDCQCETGYAYNPITHTCDNAARPLHTRALKEVNTDCPAGCASTGCVFDSTSGGYRCNKCQASLLVNAVTGTCDCPPGRFGDDNTCSDCQKSHFCPGGTYTGIGTPPQQDCPSNMTTNGRRSSSIRACVNVPGTFYTLDSAGNPGATTCPADTYGPGLKKQRACVPCPPGYITRGATGQKVLAACVVPEGYYLKVPGQVAPCPKGEYKAGFAEAASCVKCAKGVTTPDVASISEASCNILLSSFYAETIQGSTISSTKRCSAGQTFVCPGGEATQAFDPLHPAVVSGTTVLQCPDGTYTDSAGATSTSQCLTPPGFKTVDGATTQCKDGEYRADWKPPSAATSCQPCGDNIASTAAEQVALYDPATDTLKNVDVRASAASCCIKAGQGMYFSAATNTYTAVNCDSDNYGVTETTYGLAAYPCRACPAGMQTSTALPNSAAHYVSHGNGTQGFTSPLACVTKAGYGYNGRVANQCPAGSFNAAGNYDDCKQCRTGLSTPYNASKQVSDADCALAVGYGLYNDIIVPCPVGTYRDMLAADATSPCLSCPDHVTTSQAGGNSADDCNLCAAGYGDQACVTPCGGSSATFGPAGRAVDTECEACPVIKPGYYFDYLAVNQPFAPATVSRPTAESLGDCLAEFAQVEDVAWSLGGPVSLTTTDANTFEGCVEGCKADANCQYVTFDYASSKCYQKSTTASAGSAAGLGGDVLAFKALLAADTTAAKTKLDAAAKGLASGAYTYWWEASAGIGTSAVFVNTTSFQACLTACDTDPPCAAVAMTGVTTSTAPIQSCQLIKGDNTVATFKRSLTKVHTSRLVLPERPAWDVDGCAGSPCVGVSNSNHTCYDVPAPGSGYTCACDQGFAWDDVARSCLDINECVVSNGGCEQLCSNTIGSFNCTCNQGYYLDPNGKNCLPSPQCSFQYIGQYGGYGTGDNQLKKPSHLAFDSTSDTLYVVDTDNQRVVKLTNFGNGTLQFAGKFGGPRDSGLGHFNIPYWIRVRGDYVYVSERDNVRIQKLWKNGTYVSHIGGNSYGYNSFDLDKDGTYYSSENVGSGYHQMMKVAPNGTRLLTWGSQGSGDNNFLYPEGVIMTNDGNVAVVDNGNRRVKFFTTNGTFIRKFGSAGSGDGQFFDPRDIVQDKWGSFFVADKGNDRIQKFDANGSYIAKIGSTGTGNAQFRWPMGIALDKSGLIYVADNENSRIQVFSCT